MHRYLAEMCFCESINTEQVTNVIVRHKKDNLKSRGWKWIEMAKVDNADKEKKAPL